MGFRFSFAETHFTRFQAAANNQKGMNMADELDKTSAEADETTTEPEYQLLHLLIKWGIPAGIWWFLVVIVPPVMLRGTLFDTGNQLGIFTLAMILWHIIAVLMMLVHKTKVSTKVWLFILAVVLDLAWAAAVFWLILYMSFLI